MAIVIINPIVNLFADSQGEGSGITSGLGKNSCMLNFNVEEVPNYSFKDNRYLTQASLAKNMKSVGVQGFMNCINLDLLVVPASVQEIQSKAFANCRSLSKVIFEGDPSKLKIAADAFNGCSSLSWFDEDDTEAFKNIGGLYYLSDKAVIGDSEIIQGKDGNWVYTSLDYIDIPDGAFKNAIGLVEPHFKENTRIIGSEAYRYCNGLITVTIPDTIEIIKSLAFANCENLTLIEFSGDTSEIEIAHNAFSKCPKLSFFDVNDNFWKNIGKGTYYLSDKGNSDNTSTILNTTGTWVYLKNLELDVPDYAYKDADGLTEITIDPRAKIIGRQAFMNCTGLITIVIPSKVTEIKDKAFTNCSSLNSIQFFGDPSVINIARNAFDGCTSLSWFHTGDEPLARNIGGIHYISDKGNGSRIIINNTEVSIK